MQNYFNYFTEIEDHFQRRRALSSALYHRLGADRDLARGRHPALRRAAGHRRCFDKVDARKDKAQYGG